MEFSILWLDIATQRYLNFGMRMINLHSLSWQLTSILEFYFLYFCKIFSAAQNIQYISQLLQLFLPCYQLSAAPNWSLMSFPSSCTFDTLHA